MKNPQLKSNTQSSCILYEWNSPKNVWNIRSTKFHFHTTKLYQKYVYFHTNIIILYRYGWDIFLWKYRQQEYKLHLEYSRIVNIFCAAGIHLFICVLKIPCFINHIKRNTRTQRGLKCRKTTAFCVWQAPKCTFT